MRIAFFSSQSYDKTYFNEAIKNTNLEIDFFNIPLDETTVHLVNNYQAICVFVNDKINETVINTLGKNGVKMIALRCAGFNNIDLKACKNNNIRVARVPAYSPNSVAEHALALLMTLNRKTHKAYNRVRENNFSLDNLMGFDLFNKQVGVIGTGNIGKVFCKIMLGLGCKVHTVDLHPSDELIALGVEYTDLDTLYANSDVISLHCPLNEQTKHILNETAFDKMKTGVFVINTSRGALIDTKAAIINLKSKKIGALGLDVYEQEEHLFFKDLSNVIIQDDLISRLISFPNVLITAHQGFFTHEALTQIAHITVENLQCAFKNTVCKNEVV